MQGLDGQQMHIFGTAKDLLESKCIFLGEIQPMCKVSLDGADLERSYGSNRVCACGKTRLDVVDGQICINTTVLKLSLSLFLNKNRIKNSDNEDFDPSSRLSLTRIAEFRIDWIGEWQTRSFISGSR